jgi:hypothetical protein
MSYPLKHHFIPAFFLAQWTEADEKLIEYRTPLQLAHGGRGLDGDKHRWRQQALGVLGLGAGSMRGGRRPRRLWLLDEGRRRALRKRMACEPNSPDARKDKGSHRVGARHGGIATVLGLRLTQGYRMCESKQEQKRIVGRTYRPKNPAIPCLFVHMRFPCRLTRGHRPPRSCGAARSYRGALRSLGIVQAG